jgi:hypothetical protein
MIVSDISSGFLGTLGEMALIRSALILHEPRRETEKDKPPEKGDARQKKEEIKWLA